MECHQGAGVRAGRKKVTGSTRERGKGSVEAKLWRASWGGAAIRIETGVGRPLPAYPVLRRARRPHTRLSQRASWCRRLFGAASGSPPYPRARGFSALLGTLQLLLVDSVFFSDGLGALLAPDVVIRGVAYATQGWAVAGARF